MTVNDYWHAGALLAALAAAMWAAGWMQRAHMKRRHRLALLGRDKAYALLNAGFESACELQSELKQRVRELEKELAKRDHT